MHFFFLTFPAYLVEKIIRSNYLYARINQTETVGAILAESYSTVRKFTFTTTLACEAL